ncbi:MAG TPA: hypothetical protein VGS80_25010 [Ktedonobacterales bacterium]|nr:hypothetical protein [Ktedonobacterales bacterium]
MKRSWCVLLFGALVIGVALSGCEVVPQGPAQVTNVTIPPAQCAPTNQDQYVYHPVRLRILQSCIRVSGVVRASRLENDGDMHLQLELDPAYQHLLEPANNLEQGDMVIEPVCVGMPLQPDALDACAADGHPLASLPAIGQHVWMEGRYVLDLEHGSWAELHPLYRWGDEPAS